MNSMILKLSLLLAVALVAPGAFARDETPDTMLNAVTAEVMSILKQDSESVACMRVKAVDLVETKVLPLFDFSRMAQIALARNWRFASAEQQATLIAEFKTSLLRTYTAALSNYRDRVIEFKRVRMSAGDTEVRVKSEVKQTGAERMRIDYDMELTPAGWKVYDIKVGGVSLITNYRESFADTVRDEGMDGLIKSLSDRNRQLDSAIKPGKTRFLDQSRMMFAMLQSALQGRR